MIPICGLDCETHLIRRGMVYPKLVCVAFDDGAQHLFGAREGLDKALGCFHCAARGEIRLVGANVAYDAGVLIAEAQDLLPGRLADEFHELVWAAYGDDPLRPHGITDVQIREQLIDIATGDFATNARDRKQGYSLKAVARRRAGLEVDKSEDTWRIHYAALERAGVPIERWPAPARKYAGDDATLARTVWLKQAELLGEDGLDSPPDEGLQTRAAWALHLMATYGLRADAAATAALRAELLARRAEAERRLREIGIIRTDGSRDTKRVQALVAEALGPSAARTPTGLVKTGEDELRDAAKASKDPTLIHLAEIAATGNIWNTWLPKLELAVEGPLTTRANVLVETGRTSWGDPNLQNPPQKGGVRECFVPRPGYDYAGADLDTAELRAQGQNHLELFGSSALADVFREGQDPHSVLGAEILRLPYAEFATRLAAGDPEADEARQNAKRGNFSFLGLSGAARVVRMLEEQGQLPEGLGPREALRWMNGIRAAFYRRFPEQHRYRQYIERVADSGVMTHPWSGRVRKIGEAGNPFTEAANGFFQGRVADGAKLALYRLSREAHIGRGPFAGSRPVLFLHDEVIAEVPSARAAEAAAEMARILVAAVSVVIPDVPIASTPVLMRRWYKGAKPVFVDGRLHPSRPAKADGKTKWVADLDEVRS